MANKENKPKDATANVASFSKSELIEHAAELNTTSEIMAGALVSVKRDKITKQEALNAVEAFKKRVVGKEK